MFGNRTTGSGISPGTSSAFGSSSSMGGSSLGGGGQSGSGQSGAGPTNPNGVGGQARTAGSFIGANTGQTAQQNFVGAAQTNPSGAAQPGPGNFGMGGFGMGGMGMGGLIARRLGLGGFGSGASGNNTATPPPVRTALTLGFEPATAAPRQVSSAIAEHLGALPALHWQVPAQVEMQGRTAILRGVAATEHDRDLAERVVRLEPTVDQVQNQIEVAGQAVPPKALPAGNTPAADNSAAGSSATAPALGPPAQSPPARNPVDNIPPAEPAAK